MGIYHQQTVEELLELESLLASVDVFPKGFIPPGVNNPSYVPPYQGNQLIIVVIMTMFIVYPIVSLRFWVRWKSIGMGTDDWLILAATIGLTLLSVICIVGVEVVGIGYHSYDLTFHRIDMSYMLVVTYIWIYPLIVGLVRLSILFLIDRIFGQADPKFRRCIYAIMIVCVLFFIASEITLVFQCERPIANFRLKPRLTTRCPHLMANFTILSAIHIVLDVIVLFLPALKIWKLKLPMRDRLNILACFWVGLFVCATCIARTLYYGQLFSTLDIVWYGSPVLLWSHLESSLAIIISSLPALNRIIVRIFSSCFGCRKREKSQSSKTGVDDKESQKS